MSNWPESKVACPVTPQEQAWLESGMGWLAKEFGWDRLRLAPAVLATPEFFPDPFAGQPDDVRAMLDRVCGYMGIRPDTVELDFYVDRKQTFVGERMQTTNGMYEQRGGKHLVWIESGTVEDPAALVATIAHELGHVLLLGEGRISPDAGDHEQFTDLLTVFLGLGVLTSNSVVREKSWHVGHWSGWNIGKSGYLTMPQFGYALALFAHVRQEWKPDWSKALRLDVRSPFQQGARFLTESSPPTFEFKGMPNFSQSGGNVAAPDDEVEEVAAKYDGKARCTYCGVEIPSELVFPQFVSEDAAIADQPQGAPRFGICLACRDSLDENAGEVEEEQQQIEHDRRMMWRILMFGSAFLFVCFMLFLLFITRSPK